MTSADLYTQYPQRGKLGSMVKRLFDEATGQQPLKEQTLTQFLPAGLTYVSLSSRSTHGIPDTLGGCETWRHPGLSRDVTRVSWDSGGAVAGSGTVGDCRACLA